MSPRLRTALATVAVLLATVGGGLLALSTFTGERTLSVGRVALNVDPFHRGSLDLYVPLVDWGVRFGAVRFPARVKIDVRAVDRSTVEQAAAGETPTIRALRAEATDALTSYLRELVLVVLLAALGMGVLGALAVHGIDHSASWKRLLLLAAGGAAACALAVALLLPPRGALDSPEYYANGPDIPSALQALESVQRTPGVLGDELDAQLVGLAQLVQRPGERRAIDHDARLVVASDLHNNVLALPTLERAAGGASVLFAGDLTDRGTPLEASVTRRIVRSGRRFVAVAGNHDSDTLMRRLVSAGAIVLTRAGRLLPGGRHGRVVVNVGGVRIAGYGSPNERRRADDYRDRGASVTADQRSQFTAWLLPLIQHDAVDVVMVHEPQLAVDAVRLVRGEPRERTVVVVEGHTHVQSVVNRDHVLEVNGGTLGAGGTGNLAETTTIGLAVIRYTLDPYFTPLAVDTVRIDPGTGSARAARVRLG